jgi:hypothetical protein
MLAQAMPVSIKRVIPPIQVNHLLSLLLILSSTEIVIYLVCLKRIQLFGKAGEAFASPF